MVTKDSTQEIRDELNARFRDMPINSVIEQAMNDQDEIDVLQYRLGAAKFIIRQHLLKTGGTSILHSGIEVKGKYKPTEYRNDLISSFLKERFSPEELLDLGHTPSVTEMVTTPEKWDMRIVRGVGQYGTDFQEMIDKATVKGEMNDITLKRKKDKSNNKSKDEEAEE